MKITFDEFKKTEFKDIEPGKVFLSDSGTPYMKTDQGAVNLFEYSLVVFDDDELFVIPDAEMIVCYEFAEKIINP